MVKLSSLVDVYGVYTYQDYLIQFGIENFLSQEHRELAVQKDHFLNAYITALDEEILAEPLVFTPVLSEEILIDWQNENWNGLLLRFMDAARTHSFCVVDLFEKVPFWRVYTEREIKEIFYTNDKPTGCEIEYEKNMPLGKEPVTFKETLSFYDPDKPLDNEGKSLLITFGIPKGNRLGEYDIEKVWTLSVELRYINQDITNNSAKSSGFYLVKFGTGIAPTDKTNIINALDVVCSNRAVGAKTTVIEDIVAIHPENAAFSIEALVAKLNQFAGATRLPLNFFVGERQSGGFGGLETASDEVKINNKKKFIFGNFKPFIKTLVKMRWGIEVQDVECYIEEPQETSMEFGNKEEEVKDFEKKEGEQEEV